MHYLQVLLWNLVTLLPIALGGFGVFAVLACYWAENLLTGLVQFRKLRDLEARDRSAHAGQPVDPSEFPLSLFFAMHYGIFTLVHGLLVLVFFGLIHGGLWTLDWVSFGLALLGIAMVQVWGYLADWRAGGEWRRASTGRTMAEPYARVLVMHLVVLGGGWLALESADPQQVLLLFGGIKLVVELIAAAVWQRLATPR
jgi:hypothetical protein